MSREFSLSELLERSLIICAGSGGVGKTTIAASLALLGAKRGLKVLVLTIDPARRLADSLGVGPIGNQAVRIDPERLRRLGVPEGGELWAIMLDAKRTFDDLVERYAPSREVADRILANRYYQQISKSMVGSQEYMAMEHLLSAYEKGYHDLVILDTPPSRHALDFLNAPSRIRGVLEEGVLNWLLKPSSFLLKRMQRTAGVSDRTSFLETIERVIGLGMIRDLSEFVVLFKDMLGDFKDRASGSQALLAADDTRFVLVTSPNTVAVQEAAFFRDQLEKRGLPFGGFMVNRVLPLAAGDTSQAELEGLRTMDTPSWYRLFPLEPPGGMTRQDYLQTLDKLKASLDTLPTIAAIDRTNMRWLQDQGGGDHLFVQIPELPFDVHDLDGLDALGRLLQAPARALPRPIERGAS